MSHLGLPALSALRHRRDVGSAAPVVQATPPVAVAKADRAAAAVAIGASKPTASKRVVVIGGGFGGLEAAKALGNRASVDVTIVDKNDDFVFQPLLFQVATGRLKKEDITSSIAQHVARYDNASFVKGCVDDIDHGTNKITLADGRKLAFDYLIVAAGVHKGYHGHDDWSKVTVGLKTIEDAGKMRQRVLDRFEQASLEPDPAKRRALLTFVVVGGGPVGLEVSGEMTSVVKTLADRYPTIAADEPRIMLVDSADRLLARYRAKASNHAKASLEARGVEVVLGKMVSEITHDHITLDGDAIPTRNVFWAGGVKGASIGEKLGAEVDKSGRVTVQDDLSVAGHDNVFVVGDLANATSDGKRVPGVAQGAMQGADHACRSILGDMTGKARQAFEYKNLGEMAYLHRGNAVAQLPWFDMQGKAAWGLWLGVHAALLPEALTTKATVIGANLVGSAKYLGGDDAPPALGAPLLAPCAS